MLPDFPVIDIHVHVEPWWMQKPAAVDTIRKGRSDLEEIEEAVRNPDKLIALMDEAGIEKVGLINTVAPEVIGFTDAVNPWAAEYVGSSPDRFILFGSLDPRSETKVDAYLEYLIKELRIQAIKIHPPHQLFYPNDYLKGLEGLKIVYEKAQREHLPVMFHTGTSVFPGARNKYGDPLPVDDVAVDFPELTIILAHGGRPLWMDRAFFLVRRHRNVYLDISSIPPRSLLQYFPRLEEIADKTLYGSDWPGPGVKGLKENLEVFMELPLSAQVRRKILRETAVKIFG